jgi:NAD(P)-dependent dehydrogenase (short-subunit alcohol dehydrogenase family)
VTQDPIRFDDKAMLITGAGRGLGRVQALLLASRGASVIVADNGTAMDGEDPDLGPAKAVVAEIEAAGGRAVAFTADLSVEASAGEAVETCLATFGRIDGIVHYASTCPNPAPAEQLSTRDLDLVMRINPFAALWLARAAWPHMAAKRHGRIVYLSSGGAYGALGATTYGAAKAAIIGVMRCLALEGISQGILVNAIAPSARSRMTERFQASAYADWFLQTMAPEKVAVAVAWLLSDACDVHGEIFAIGGGRISRITLAENEGTFETSTSIEEVGDMIAQVMADQRFFYPGNLGDRSAKVAALFGFDGSFQANNAYSVRTIEH